MWRKGGTVGYQSLCRPVKVATSACDLVVSGRSSSELGLYTSACLPLQSAQSVRVDAQVVQSLRSNSSCADKDCSGGNLWYYIVC